MRHFLILLLLQASTASAVPVYLRPDSLFESGEYPRPWLEKRTIETREQNWIRVKTLSGETGWAPEKYWLTQTDLNQQATLLKDFALRLRPRLDSASGLSLAARTHLNIIERKDSWAKVTLPTSPKNAYWVPKKYLSPVLSGSERAYVLNKSPLRASPSNSAVQLRTIETGSIVDVVKMDGKFVLVRSIGTMGYLSLNALVLRKSFSPQQVVTTLDNLPLRSSPSPLGDLVKSLPLGSTALKIDSHVQKWGNVVLDDDDLWWPIDATDSENESTHAPSALRLNTRDLFTRKIFDLASSPLIQNFKLAAAQGIFRTINGKEWTQLLEFKENNYPIAFAKNGFSFVGPYVSTDNGESFELYIHWPKLVTTLHSAYGVVPTNIKILKIMPLDLMGQQLDLLLEIGTQIQVKVRTLDQGITWKTLNSKQVQTVRNPVKATKQKL